MITGSTVEQCLSYIPLVLKVGTFCRTETRAPVHVMGDSTATLSRGPNCRTRHGQILVLTDHSNKNPDATTYIFYNFY